MPNSYNPGVLFTETSGYGYRDNPFSHNGIEFHPGQDFKAPVGTSIPAASSGTVVYSGFNAGGYGYTVIIKSTGADGKTYYTLYAHQNGNDMPALGDRVNQGDTIGQVGHTGRSTSPHLHFEILSGDAPVNNASGGPLGFTSSDKSIRYDPSTFNNWAESRHPRNGAKEVEENETKGSIVRDAVDTWQNMELSNEPIAFGIAAIKNKAGDTGASNQMKPQSLGDRIDWVWRKAEAIRDFLVGHPISGDYKIRFIDIVHAIWQGNVNAESVSSVFNAIKEIHADDRVNKNSFNDAYDRALQRLDAVKRHEDSSQRNSSLSETLRRDASDYKKVYRVEPDGSTRGYFESD